MLNKLFNGNSIDHNGIPTELFPQQNMCEYHLSVLWTRDGSPLSLIALSGKFSDSTEWHNLCPTRISDNDGEITVSIGRFPVGRSLDFIFSVYAIEDIRAARLYLVNVTNNTHRQLMPANGSQPIPRGTAWSNQVTQILG